MTTAIKKESQRTGQPIQEIVIKEFGNIPELVRYEVTHPVSVKEIKHPLERICPETGDFTTMVPASEDLAKTGMETWESQYKCDTCQCYHGFLLLQKTMAVDQYLNVQSHKPSL